MMNVFRFRLRTRDDRGFALITALLVVVIATFLGATAVGLAVHGQDSSGEDRARTQAVHAAEAGLDLAMQTISSATAATLPCTTTGSTSLSPAATWSAQISYYGTFPPSGGPLPCTAGTGVTGTPLTAVIVSTGSIGVTGGTVERAMQAQTKLTALYGTFDKAIFSEGSPDITNRLNLLGFNGNDANFYTNGNWTCSNQTTVNGSVVAQGFVAMSNSCYVANDIWANGAITMENIAKGDHDAISSTSTMTMAGQSKLTRNVRLGSTCTGCTTGSSGRVGGSVTTSSPQAAPPVEVYPTINYDASAWTIYDYQVVNYSDCAAARTWLTSAANNGTKAVLRITGCTLNLVNDTVTRTNDLAIFSDSPIVTGSNTLFTSGDGDFHDFFMIVGSGITCSGTTSGSPGTIFMASSTGFSTLHFFVYAPCTVSFANNNSGSKGQIYGNPVKLASQMSYTYYPTVVPGAGAATGFKPELSYIREIKPL